ncbi:MAG: hypothetical protein ACWGQW_10235 [bacterium]
MPSKFVGAVARVIFWRYQRGSWQYDVLCGLILAFIFLTPQTVFDGRAFNEDENPTKADEQRVSIDIKHGKRAAAD